MLFFYLSTYVFRAPFVCEMPKGGGEYTAQTEATKPTEPATDAPVTKFTWPPNIWDSFKSFIPAWKF